MPEDPRIDSRKEAIRGLLSHYFRMVWPNERLTWDWDNDAEMISLVDFIDDLIQYRVKDAIYESESKRETRGKSEY